MGERKIQKPIADSLGWALFRSDYSKGGDPIDGKSSPGREEDKDVKKGSGAEIPGFEIEIVQKAAKAGEMSDKFFGTMNDLVRDELIAVTTYMHQASFANGLGYAGIAEHFWGEVGEEMGHAMKLMDRVNLFGRVPGWGIVPAVEHKKTIKAMLEHQLKLEKGALMNYNEAVHLARDERDEGTADLLTEILRDEELHFDWLTAQLSRIETIGEERYLAEIESTDGEPTWDSAPEVEIEEED